MDPKENGEIPWTAMTIGQKLNYIWLNITVEPAIFCLIMPCCLSALACSNLNLEKACRVNLKYNETICDALMSRETEKYAFEESEVQRLVSEMTRWKTIIQSSIPCVLVIFFGAWSDKVGKRRLCILLPMFGELLATIGLILNQFFFYEWRMEIAGVTESFLPAITGGWFTMFMGAFSYIADMTDENMRTVRIGIANLICNLAVPVGTSASGILLKAIGYYGTFSVSLVIQLIGFIYGYYKIKEPNKIKPQIDPQGFKQHLKVFCDWRSATNTLMLAFKSGSKSRRLRIIMLMIVMCVVTGPIYAEMNLLYLFTRYKFNWDEVAYSFYSTYILILHSLGERRRLWGDTNLPSNKASNPPEVRGLLAPWLPVLAGYLRLELTFKILSSSRLGTLFSIWILSHRFKLDDAIIGIISSMSKILSSFIYAFAETTLLFYIGPIVEILNGTSIIAMRSIASKLVPSNDLGKINAIFGIAEAAMPVVYVPMYTTVYLATMTTFPGAFFLLGAALTGPAVAIFGWLYTVHRKETTDKRMNQIKEDEEKQQFEMSNDIKEIELNICASINTCH